MPLFPACQRVEHPRNLFQIAQPWRSGCKRRSSLDRRDSDAEHNEVQHLYRRTIRRTNPSHELQSLRRVFHAARHTGE